jgi:hypothetical protein
MNQATKTAPTKALKPIPTEKTKGKGLIEENTELSISTKEMKNFLKEETEKRKILEEYITQNLKSGVDFGTIDIKYKDKQTGEGKVIKSKPTLLKPGAEKICSLLHLKPKWRIDHEMISIIGKGEIPFICDLVKESTGEWNGEGRGSCSISEKTKDEKTNNNSAIKIAKKRAMVDAILNVAALSDRFSQDLEDKDVQKSIAQQYENKPPLTTQKTDNFSGLATPEQIGRIEKMLKHFEVKILHSEIAKAHGATTGDFADLPQKSAYWLLKNSEDCAKEAKTKTELTGKTPDSDLGKVYTSCPSCNAKYQSLMPSKFGENAFYLPCKICKSNISFPFKI